MYILCIESFEIQWIILANNSLKNTTRIWLFCVDCLKLLISFLFKLIGAVGTFKLDIIYIILYYVRLVCGLRILVRRWGLKPNLVSMTTNRSRNHHSTHLGQNSIAGRQARLLQILNDHTVMRCSLLSSKGCQLMQTNPRCSGERCKYCDRIMSVLLLRS